MEKKSKIKKKHQCSFIHENYIAPTIAGIISAIIAGFVLLQIDNLKKEVKLQNILLIDTLIKEQNTFIKEFRQQNTSFALSDSAKIENQMTVETVGVGVNSGTIEKIEIK